MKRFGVFVALWCAVLSTGIALAAPAPRALPAATSARIRALLASPEFAASRIGIAVVGLGTVASPQAFPSHPFDGGARPLLFEVDSGKRFLPASNFKLYTAALALHVLGPDYRFTSQVTLVPGDPSLRLIGGGDPSLDFDDLRDLARQSAAHGVRVADNIVADGSAFHAEAFGGRYPDGWTLDDALWYYGPEVDALALHRNQVDLYVTGAAREGEPAKVRLDPIVPGFSLGDGIHADIKTGDQSLSSRSDDDLLTFDRAHGTSAIGDSLEVTGAVAPGQSFDEGAAVPNHDIWAGRVFAGILRENGVRVTGSVSAAPYIQPASANLSTDFKIVLAKELVVATHRSAPLRDLVKHMIKTSDNLYAEMLLRETARSLGATPSSDCAAVGHRALLQLLHASGIDTAPLHATDGSGLSRYDLVTPIATARLLSLMDGAPGGEALWEALPIAGQDGTLKKRMRGSAAAGNVRAKTGSFSIVSCLSGYVTTRDGRRLAVSMLTNFAPSTDQSRSLQDEVFKTLAEATW